ncbi:MAG: hypothetical protein ND866_29140 [Pyrinomonadaceae bacterium]|nr:hypothetical protein [Pyrinomonadaceae bacterium]
MKEGALLVPQRAVSELQGTYQVAVVGTDKKVSTVCALYPPQSFDQIVYALGGTTPTNFLKAIGIAFDGSVPGRLRNQCTRVVSDRRFECWKEGWLYQSGVQHGS